MPFIAAVEISVEAACPASKASPVVFVTIEASDVFPVVCKALVEAPIGNGSDAAEIGCVA